MIASYNQGYLHLLEIWLLGSVLVFGFLWLSERRTPARVTWVLPAAAPLVVAWALVNHGRGYEASSRVVPLVTWGWVDASHQ